MKALLLGFVLFTFMSASSYAQQMGSESGGGSNCPPASQSRLEISAILNSKEVFNAINTSFGVRMSSFIKEISLKSIARSNVYLIKTSLSDGSMEGLFEVEVSGARKCLDDSAQVTAIRKI
jgi:hypothetical protein